MSRILAVLLLIRAAGQCEDVAMLQTGKKGYDSEMDTVETHIHNETPVQYFPLPMSLAMLRKVDPAYDQLQKSAQKYALQLEPGKGGVLDYALVKTKHLQSFHRVWGGNAKQCGFWWLLPNPKAIAPNGEISLFALMEAAGVCPEWNNGTFLESCTVPADWSFVVGQGQSATC
ncbi:Uncharacterized protein SCF082_LOCUS24038 [Durusdinium trenchii]|uniref:Uncharacterized protein n=1 Tax=Durusdinium trenchii TaxID=1381693 RepID=A0ABP0LR48_9DINO